MDVLVDPAAWLRGLAGGVLIGVSSLLLLMFNGRIAGEWQYGIQTADVDTYSAEAWAAHFFPNGRQLRVILSGAVAAMPNSPEPCGATITAAPTGSSAGRPVPTAITSSSASPR